MDIMTEENMELIYLLVRSSSMKGEEVKKEVDGGNRYFSQLQDSLY